MQLMHTSQQKRKLAMLMKNVFLSVNNLGYPYDFLPHEMESE